MSKVIDAAAAVECVKDGMTIAATGFRWAGASELLLRTLGERFARTGHPRDLTLVFSSASGDSVSNGLEHLAAPGMLRRVVGGFWGVTPRIAELAREGKIEAYNFPQGQIARLYGAIASGLPGLISKIGIGTYIDPRQGGGRLNDRTPEDLVEVIRLRGEEWLLYHSIPIDVAFVRGTTADEHGNVSMEHEAMTTEALSLAFAAHNSGGRVIVQAAKTAPRGTIHPRSVAIPGYVVDAVVSANDLATEHRQCAVSVYDPRLTGDEPAANLGTIEEPALLRSLVARRAMRELKDGDVVNLGQGIPSEIASLIRGTALHNRVDFTVESGVAGGVPRAVPDFGIAENPDAILRQDDQFTFYNGGGLDVAFLGFAEVDSIGNVNASYFRGRSVGCGGFLDIAYPAKRLVFCGTFTAGDLEVEVRDGRLRIVREGRVRKFVKSLQQLMFNAERARSGAQSALFVTERCVFEITGSGLRLMEIAPGLDIERDVMAQMDFRPLVAENLGNSLVRNV